MDHNDEHSTVVRGQSSGGMGWSNGGPILRMEDAVVETVVTHTTRTTTSFAPITLPKVPAPEALGLPTHLNPEQYPLAEQPAPADLRFFTLMLGGRRVVVHDDSSGPTGADAQIQASGPGWTRTLLSSGAAVQGQGGLPVPDERLGFLQALNRSKGKEVRKRPHNFSRPASRVNEEVRMEATPPISSTDVLARRTSPPRKKIRGLDDLKLSQGGNTSLLSPLPSPEQEAGPSTAPSSSGSASPPTLGSGLEVAALFSLPSLASQYDALPDRLQQHLLMHLLRRSRMPTIQRIHTFTGVALKRDFIALLPHELAVLILRKADRASLAVASRVCKRWKRMIDTERSVWRQRLIDDDLYSGHGVEEEEEKKITERYEALDWKAEIEGNDNNRVDTPSDDERMLSATLPRSMSEIDRPHPLKHVYRRRYQNQKSWLHVRPEHNSFPGHGTNVVTCLQFDDDKIVSASDDHSINIYNTSDGQLRKRLDGHEGGVWTLEYKGDTLVSGSTDRTIRVWDLEELRETHVFHGHSSTVRCLQIVEPVWDEASGEFQPPYPMIVTGSRDASLRVWKLPRKGEPAYSRTFGSGHENEVVPPEENPFHLHLLEGHTQAVRTLAAHGRICVSGSYDMSVRVWDIVKGTCIHTLNGHEAKVYSIVYDRFRNRCASGSMDNTVKVWDVTTGECLHTLTGHTSLVGLLGLSPNYLVSAAADASLRIWDPDTCQQKNVLASHGGAITCFQHDETKVVSGSDGTLKLWDIRTGAYIRDLVVGISSVWQVAFNGNLLVAASNRGGATVFDVFNFGSTAHPSGVDDDRLDTMRPPAWQRGIKREPHTYQSSNGWDSDGGAYSPSPTRQNTGTARWRDLSLSGPGGVQGTTPTSSASKSQRRSTRLAGRSTAAVRGDNTTSASASASGHYSERRARVDSHRTSRRFRIGGEVESPTPSGGGGGAASRHGSMSAAGQSFAPIFDEGLDGQRDNANQDEFEEDEVMEDL
ncbi:hypothetical protein CI109_105182 [Kwoniella shandongensis]|uniref:Uncharacterized protein n=1 Tax=Kwoniella shandongensis TaxID=1734106 RepID=A0A5M6C380_9TREE|nr:uncharacterized protein CI109_002023 [Kwoniella shandongensis]KAA5529598.1 hypothetical protein CI109_002023 [Kwoniella shandongensis]